MPPSTFQRYVYEEDFMDSAVEAIPESVMQHKNTLDMNGVEGTDDMLYELMFDIGMNGKRNPYIDIKNLATAAPDDLYTTLHGSPVNRLKKDSIKSRGISTGAGSARQAFFSTNSPRDAEFYATQARNALKIRAESIANKIDEKAYDKLLSGLNSLDLRPNNKLSARDKFNKALDSSNKILNNSDKAKRLYNRADKIKNTEYSSAPTNYPLVTKTKNPKFVNLAGEFKMGQLNKELALAKQEGHDAVILFDHRDPSKGAVHIATFDPSQRRSITAAFDPKKVKSSNWMAGLVGLGLLSNQQE